MGERSRSRSRGAALSPPPDVGPSPAGGQAARAADDKDIIDELFGDLGRVRELTDAIVIAPPGANLVPPGPPALTGVSRGGPTFSEMISIGSTYPGPASELPQERRVRSGARASSPRGEVAPVEPSIHMYKDEILYLTHTLSDRHPSAAWDERVYLAGVGRQVPATQSSTDNKLPDLEAGAGTMIDEAYHGAATPDTPTFWQRLSAIRVSAWRVISTVFMAAFSSVRLGIGLPTLWWRRDTNVHHATGHEVQTESVSLFLGRLRGHSTSHEQGGRADTHVQVNDNAEILIRGSYIPTPRDPYTGEVVVMAPRAAPNGTPYLVPDLDRGLEIAYLQRRTWRLMYMLKVRETFNDIIFAEIDDTVKSDWMRRVFTFVNPYPRIEAVGDASSSDSEMPGLYNNDDSDTQRAESSASRSDDDDGDAFANAFRMMMNLPDEIHQRTHSTDAVRDVLRANVDRTAHMRDTPTDISSLGMHTELIDLQPQELLEESLSGLSDNPPDEETRQRLIDHFRRRDVNANNDTHTRQEDARNALIYRRAIDEWSGSGEPDEEPDTAIRRAGRNLTHNTGMQFVTFHNFDHGQRCHLCSMLLLQGEGVMIDRDGQVAHSRCLATTLGEPDSPDSIEGEERLRLMSERIAVMEEDLRASRIRLAERNAATAERTAVMEEDLRASRVRLAEHDAATAVARSRRAARRSSRITASISDIDTQSTVGTHIVLPERPGRGAVYAGRHVPARQVLTIPHGDTEAPGAVIEENVGHGAPMPESLEAGNAAGGSSNPYDSSSDGYTRYGARVPAAVASQRADVAIPPDVEANRWPAVSDMRPLAAEETFTPFDPMRYPGYRTLVSAMSQFKNKFIAYVRGMFSEELINERVEKGRRVWESRRELPHRYALGGEWTTAPLIWGREPAHTEQFIRYEGQADKKTQLTRIGPHPVSLWTKRVASDGGEGDDPPRAVYQPGVFRDERTSPYVRVYEHPRGQSPFQRYHNIFVQLDRPYDITKNKGNWFAEDLPAFVTSLDRTCRHAVHESYPYNVGNPAPIPIIDPADTAILAGFPADLHVSILVPPGGPQPSTPRKIVHQAYYGAGSTRGGSIVQWVGNSLNDDEVWGRAVCNQEFAFDLHALRHERGMAAKKIWQSRPENRFREVPDAARCYPSAPFAKKQVYAKLYDNIYLPEEEAMYSDAWDHNTIHSLGHAGHGSVNWKTFLQRRPGNYRQQAKVELRRSAQGFQTADEALSRNLPTYLEVMPHWPLPVIHDTDFALLSLTSFVSSDRVAMWFWHANQAVLDVGQPARIFPLVYLQAHEPLDKPLMEYGKTPMPHADVIRIAYAGRDGRLKTDSFIIKRKKGDSDGWQQADLRDTIYLINKCLRVLRYRRYNPDVLQINDVIQQRWEKRVVGAVVVNRMKSWRAVACSQCGYQNLLLGARETAKTISHCQFIAAQRDETRRLFISRSRWGVEPRLGLAEARQQEEGWHRAKFCPCLTAVWCSAICANDVTHGESHYQSDGHRRYTVLMMVMRTKVKDNRDFAKEMVIQILRYLRVLHGHSYGAMPFFWKF